MKQPEIEDIVFLKTDPEMLPRMITGFTTRKSGVTYEIACGPGVSWHFDFEFVYSKDELNKQIGFNHANSQGSK